MLVDVRFAGRPMSWLAWITSTSSPHTEHRASAWWAASTLLSFERSVGPAVSRSRRFSAGGWRCQCRPGRARAHLENSIATSTHVLFDQENKSTRWMPWRQEPMKDVGGCDKSRGGADQPLIRESPNEETHAW